VHAMMALLTEAASRAAAGLVLSAVLHSIHSLERQLGELLLDAGACSCIVDTPMVPMPFAYITYIVHLVHLRLAVKAVCLRGNAGLVLHGLTEMDGAYAWHEPLGNDAD
jgi:hypothetical protein